MRKRITTVLLTGMIIFFTTSCNSSSIVPAANAPAAAPPAEEILFLLPSGADETLQNSAAFFCEETLKRSGGLLRIAIKESGSITTHFEAGNVGFALVDTRANTGFCSYFPLLSEPYLFTGYEHYTMTMNSQTVFSALSEGMAAKNALPLAAFYTGSDFLLSTLRIDEYTNFEGMTIDGDEHPQPETIPVVAMNGESDIRRTLYSRLGSIAISSGGAQERIRELGEGGVQVAEFAPADVPAMVRVPAGETEVYLTQSFHSVSPLWLVADKACYEALSAENKAAVKEVIALMFDQIDGFYRRDEKKNLESLLSHTVLMGWDFTRTRVKIRALIDAGIASHSDDDKRLLKYMYSVSVPD